MPDPIAAAFTGEWKLTAKQVESSGALALVQVMLVQEAWRRLTTRSRRALLAIEEQPGLVVYHHTRSCLIRHGLITPKNRLTRAGRAVIRHRPPTTSTPIPYRLAGRPVIDVHLPAEVTP